MRNSAVYVARVGGLAVALGIGTALASGQGLALADSPDGAPGPASNDPSQSKSESPDAGPTAGPAESAAPGQGVGSGSPSSPASNRDEPAGNGIVRSSGGAQTSSNPSTSVDTTSDDPSASTPTSTDEASTAGPVDTEPDTAGEVTPSVSGQPAADLTDPTETSAQSAQSRRRHPSGHRRPTTSPPGMLTLGHRRPASPGRPIAWDNRRSTAQAAPPTPSFRSSN